MELTLDYSQEIDHILKTGAALLQKNQIHQAIALYENGTQRHPNSAAIWHNLALLQKDQRNIPAFISCSRRAYLLDPSSVVTKIHICQSLLYEGKEQQAQQLFTTLSTENPKAWAVCFAYAETLYNVGKSAKAKEILLSCPQKPHVLHLLGSIELEIGDISLGCKHLQDSYFLSRNSSIPIWNGEDVKGKTLFIDTQNNVEDLLVFLRFLPIEGVKFCIDQPYFAVFRNLLSKSFPKNVKVYEKTDHIDFICCLAHLPTISQKDLKQPPPVLTLDNPQVQYWKEFLQKDKSLKIAFLEYEDSESFSFQFPKITGATFYKLHTKQPSCFAVNNIDLSKRFFSLAEVSALLAHMNIVITTSKIVAHLSSLLNKQTYLLLNTHKGSKWFSKEQKDRWYTNLDLFTFDDPASFKQSIEDIIVAINLEIEIVDLINQSKILYEQEKYAEGMALSEKITEKKPKDIRGWHSLGYGAFKQKKYDLALNYLETRLQYHFHDPLFSIDFSSILAHQGKFSEAEALLAPILEKHPRQFPLAYANLGSVLAAQEKMDEGIKLLETAIQLDPQNLDYPINLSCAYLRKGDFIKGWSAGLTHFILKYKKKNSMPIWRGENLQGKTLLVLNDQGIGDCFQYIRYVPLLEKKGINIVLHPDRMDPMKSLFLHSFPKKNLFYEKGMKIDYGCPVCYLGLIDQTTLSTIPANVPYLTPSTYKISDWKKFFAKDSNYKVGIVWKGNPKQRNDLNRSTTLARFASLARGTKNCTFYSLQKDRGEDPPEGMSFIDLSSKLKTFDDTAAILTQLDLVITVDTSVAHLAGALGRPTWIILGYPAAQQWLLQREDSPWYPTVRLFRSKCHDGWDPLLEEVKENLQKIIFERNKLEANLISSEGSSMELLESTRL